MLKPTFPPVVRFTGEEIRSVRSYYRMSRTQFCRYFGLEGDTIKKYETGINNISGPAAIIFQDLKAWADYSKEKKSEALDSILKGQRK